MRELTLLNYHTLGIHINKKNGQCKWKEAKEKNIKKNIMNALLAVKRNKITV